jgi:predicted DNA-binding transcriptional regulator AlpA
MAMIAERLLSPAEVEEMYNIPTTTLEKWRSLKMGPPYHKLGKHIRYKPKDVEQWIESKRVLTTA